MICKRFARRKAFAMRWMIEGTGPVGLDRALYGFTPILSFPSANHKDGATRVLDSATGVMILMGVAPPFRPLLGEGWVASCDPILSFAYANHKDGATCIHDPGGGCPTLSPAFGRRVGPSRNPILSFAYANH
jgi:hypothetical protein